MIIRSNSVRVDSALGRRTAKSRSFREMCTDGPKKSHKKELLHLDTQIVVPLHSIHSAQSTPTNNCQSNQSFSIRRLLGNRKISRSPIRLSELKVRIESKAIQSVESRQPNIISMTQGSDPQSFFTCLQFPTQKGFQLKRRLIRGLALTSTNLQPPRYRYLGLAQRRSYRQLTQ